MRSRFALIFFRLFRQNKNFIQKKPKRTQNENEINETESMELISINTFFSTHVQC